MTRFLIPTLGLLLAGCATQGVHMDTGKLEQLKLGISTMADAEALLGKPQSIARHPDGSTTLRCRWANGGDNGKSHRGLV